MGAVLHWLRDGSETHIPYLELPVPGQFTASTSSHDEVGGPPEEELGNSGQSSAGSSHLRTKALGKRNGKREVKDEDDREIQKTKFEVDRGSDDIAAETEENESRDMREEKDEKEEKEEKDEKEEIEGKEENDREIQKTKFEVDRGSDDIAEEKEE